MIPTLGLMLATYAIARLIQVPFEVYTVGKANVRCAAVTLVSAGAIVLIVLLAGSLVLSGAKMPALP